jgi:Na+-transporting methylmalonyl-CoA/oxaloacetate decarboxylase gamma subunit
MNRFLMLTLLAFVASCERAAVREYLAPKQTFPQKAAVREEIEQAQNSAQPPAISLKAPPHWQRQPPAPMRKASFVVQEADGAKVDISVTSFPAESGGLLANINRWRGQLGLNAVDAEQLESTVERRNLGGREFVIVDFVNEESPADKKQRIIGAVVPASGETWFFKMTGGDALTAAQKTAFLEVLESVEFRSQ